MYIYIYIRRVNASARNRRHVANKAEKDKVAKYAELADRYQVRAIAFETMGPASDSTVGLIKAIGRRIAQATGDTRSGDFLLQRLSLAVQRGNATAVLGSMPRQPTGIGVRGPRSGHPDNTFYIS